MKYFPSYIKETKLSDHQIDGKQGKRKVGALRKLMNNQNM